METHKVVLTLLIAYLLTRILSLRIVDRRGRLPQHPSKRFPTRTLAQIEQIVVHHSGGHNDTLTGINTYHTGPNHVCEDGCPGTLYHLVVDENDRLVYVNDLRTIVWSVHQQNTRTAAICLLGNYETDKPSAAQLKALRRGIRFIERTVGRKLPIGGHGEVCPSCRTACPGQYLEKEISAW